MAVAHAVISTSVTISATASIATTASPSTCPFRTINYITQTLPQQCLTSSWASKPSIQSSSNPAALSSVDVLSTFLVLNTSQHTSPDAPRITAAVVESPDPVANSASNSSTLTAQLGATTETSKEAGQAGDTNQESDSDSPLDRANFLSFEEWKHQNLAKAGQSAENLGSRDGVEKRDKGRTPGSISNALESLGEDSEIDLDFSGFGNAGGINDALPVQSALPQGPDAEAGDKEETMEDLSSPHRRNKDAGKTCKERSNYASFDCAATALKTNPECKGITSVLVESKDSYMLNVCSAKNKFFIMELCDDILIDTVVLANFEYFSSMFRTFRVSVSDRYPVKIDKWRELGTFEARNSREIQAFLVETPLIWARYLRIEFLTHYGAEYYCPISLLRVHGTTMMEEFNHEVKGARGDDENDSEDTGSSDEAIIQTPKAVPETLSETKAQEVPRHNTDGPESPRTPISILNMPSVRSETSSFEERRDSSSIEDFTPYRLSIGRALEDVLSCKEDRAERCSYSIQPKQDTLTSTASPSAASEPESLAIAHEVPSGGQNAKAVSQEAQHSRQQIEKPVVPSKTNSLKHPVDTIVKDGSGTYSTHATNHAPHSSAVTSVQSNSTYSRTSSIKSQGTSNTTSVPDSKNGTQIPSTTNSTKAPPALTQSPAANPSTQESFFKSVHKRLQQLEANSTLSLQYIEEQSRILRDAFSKVEKRQLSKTSTFLETINTTVLTELHEFRMQYDQIWQSTVLELSSQREQSAREVSVLSARMTFLADEVVFQKRMAMIQFMLILLCLGFVVFSRNGGVSTHLELPPLVQNAISRSSANVARYTQFETPPMSPSSTRPPSTGTSSKGAMYRRKAHAHSPSDDSDVISQAKSPAIEYCPPTPPSRDSPRDRNASPSGPSEDESDTLNSGDPASDHDIPRATINDPRAPAGVQAQGSGPPQKGSDLL